MKKDVFPPPSTGRRRAAVPHLAFFKGKTLLSPFSPKMQHTTFRYIYDTLLPLTLVKRREEHPRARSGEQARDYIIK